MKQKIGRKASGRKQLNRYLTFTQTKARIFCIALIAIADTEACTLMKKFPHARKFSIDFSSVFSTVSPYLIHCDSTVALGPWMSQLPLMTYQSFCYCFHACLVMIYHNSVVDKWQ